MQGWKELRWPQGGPAMPESNERRMLLAHRLAGQTIMASTTRKENRPMRRSVALALLVTLVLAFLMVAEGQACPGR
jgi:hypothetical protein